MRIGVLALQGAFVEHRIALERLGVETVEVRVPADLQDSQGLIIPGGESTAMSRLLRDYGLLEPLRRRMDQGYPVYGTCAGMILLAREVDGHPGGPFGLMDIAVRRNAYGRQVDSFEADVKVSSLGEAPFHAIFIRAPAVYRVGPSVQVLATKEDRAVVAALEANLMVSAFHPELTQDLRFHRRFLDLVDARSRAAVSVR